MIHIKFLLMIPFLFGLAFQSEGSNENDQKTYIVINTNSELIHYSERGNSVFIRIEFLRPNLKAYAIHVRKKIYEDDYDHKEVELKQSDLFDSRTLFADKLSFSDWSDLEKIGENQKIYVIFHDEYMSRDRFIWNHKLKALEVWVTADGPI